MNKKSFIEVYIKRYFLVLLGTFIFCVGNNFFVVPASLYSSGFLGFSQVLRTVLVDYMHLSVPNNVDISGIINFVFNIPLFVIALRSLSKDFLFKTIFSLVLQTIFITYLPIPSTLLIHDVLADCVIGGVISGFGIGLILLASGSGGGCDILGCYFSKKFKNFSVGKISIMINFVLYSICAVLFNIETAIYSIIYVFVFSLIVDKIHAQNINTMALVFTKNKTIPDSIMKTTHRGVTQWHGEGAYTMEDTLIFVTIISKYEISQIKSLVYDIDPKAFVIFTEVNGVVGNFEKRL